MSLDAKQFRALIVRPALEAIGLWSQEAENLVCGTAAQESRLSYVKQIGTGPALGLFQMEPATHDDIWNNYLRYNLGWVAAVKRLAATDDGNPRGFPDASEMVWNLRYAAAMCRIHYRRQPGAIPFSLEGMAAYWKKYYNTVLGDGTPQQFIQNYSLIG